MNGPAVVYRLKPVFEIPRNLDLPSCMYRMKNPVACVTTSSDHTDDEKEILAGIMDKNSTPELAVLEAKWDSLLKQFSELKLQVESIKKVIGESCKLAGYSVVDDKTLDGLKIFQGAVINANPSNPPYSLLLVKHLYKSSLPINISNHIHSTVSSSLPENIKYFTQESFEDNSGLKLILIWKDNSDTELIINPVKQLPIKGEVNILRFLARSGLQLLKYPSNDLVETISTDSILDLCHRLVHVTAPKERASLFRNLNAKLGRCLYFGGEDLNISDIAVWSALKQIKINPAQDLSQTLAKWYERIDKILF